VAHDSDVADIAPGHVAAARDGRNLAQIVEETRATLEQDLPLALLAALTRLQKDAVAPIAPPKLLSDAGIADVDGTIARAQWFLASVPLDGETFGRLRHSTDEEAAEALIDDADGPVRRVLVTLGGRVEWIRRALALYDAIRFASCCAPDGLASVAAGTFHDGGAQLLARSSYPHDVLKQIPWDGLGFWELRDVAFEIVRSWPRLARIGRLVADEALAHLLADRDRFGTYLAFEAATYLQRAVHPRVWAAVADALWEVADDREAELGAVPNSATA
jgi:hypothetical protein